MTDTAAAFDDVTVLNGRGVPLGACCQAIAVNVCLGATAIATVAALVTCATLAAAWILGTGFSTNPHFRTYMPKGPATIALAVRQPKFTRTVPSVPDTTARRSTETPDLTFDAKWARAVAPAPARAGVITVVTKEVSKPVSPALPKHLPGHVKPRLASVPPATRLANLPPAVAPAPAAPQIDSRASLRPPTLSAPVPLPKPRPAVRDVAPALVEKTIPQAVTVMPPQTETNKKAALPERTRKKVAPLLGPDSRTAVYVIAAHTVYLPDGRRLEAHSGLGSKLDDPRYVRTKNRGPTPPNIYDLSLRRQLFHGVRAIRLTPVAGSTMFGRDGMLAHSYMLGPNGQSNGCVSFRNYRAFLEAYLRGEIDRLVVVAHSGDAPAQIARATSQSDDRYAANGPSAASSAITW